MSGQKTTRDHAPYRRTKVFISYRRADGAGDAERLYDELKRYFAARQLFLDVKSIRRGDRFPLAIDAALEASPALLAVIGPRWLGAADEQGRRRLDDASDLVRREISAALARGAWVIPVLLYDTPMPKAEDLPEDLKQLAECQAVEIRSGYWETGVKELARLLKLRLRRGERLARALSTAAALALVAALLYRYAATAPTVDPNAAAAPTVDLKAGDDDAVRVNYSDKEEEQQEIVVEGIDTNEGGELLNYDGKLVADVMAEFDSARLAEDSIKDLQPPGGRGESWGRVSYTGRPDEKADADASRACRTSVKVRAAPGGTPPASLRLFQERVALESSDAYREVWMQSGGELIVYLGVMGAGGVEEPNGFGCSKEITFGDDTPAFNIGDRPAHLHARADTRLSFRFQPMHPGDTPPEPGWLKLEKGGVIEPFDLSATRLHARRVIIRTRQGHAISYDARAADDRSPLRLRSLHIGHDYLQLGVEGRAYVAGRRDGNTSPNLSARSRRDSGHTLLLLTTSASLFVCFLCALFKL